MAQGKGRRTRRRGEVQAEKRSRAEQLRAWLDDRFAAAQKRNAAGRRRRPSGSGVTAQMREISREAAARETEYVVKHTAPNRQMRRAGHARGAQGTNTPYVTPPLSTQVAQRLMDRVRGGRRSS